VLLHSTAFSLYINIYENIYIFINININVGNETDWHECKKREDLDLGAKQPNTQSHIEPRCRHSRHL
jgi:hypothetical protein